MIELQLPDAVLELDPDLRAFGLRPGRTSRVQRSLFRR